MFTSLFFLPISVFFPFLLSCLCFLLFSSFLSLYSSLFFPSPLCFLFFLPLFVSFLFFLPIFVFFFFLLFSSSFFSDGCHFESGVLNPSSVCRFEEAPACSVYAHQMALHAETGSGPPNANYVNNVNHVNNVNNANNVNHVTSAASSSAAVLERMSSLPTAVSEYDAPGGGSVGGGGVGGGGGGGGGGGVVGNDCGRTDSGSPYRSVPALHASDSSLLSNAVTSEYDVIQAQQLQQRQQQQQQQQLQLLDQHHYQIAVNGYHATVDTSHDLNHLNNNNNSNSNNNDNIIDSSSNNNTAAETELCENNYVNDDPRLSRRSCGDGQSENIDTPTTMDSFSSVYHHPQHQQQSQQHLIVSTASNSVNEAMFRREMLQPQHKQQQHQQQQPPRVGSLSSLHLMPSDDVSAITSGAPLASAIIPQSAPLPVASSYHDVSSSAVSSTAFPYPLPPPPPPPLPPHPAQLSNSSSSASSPAVEGDLQRFQYF